MGSLAAQGIDLLEVLAGEGQQLAIAGVVGRFDRDHSLGDLGVARLLRAYRSGGRNHAVMKVIAAPLSDADIDDLATWFAAIKVEATAPP